MAEILLGVTGSVACYRAADLARELMRAGHTVRACLTRSAGKFVTPALFEALTGNPALIDAFDEPERGRMAHIDLARKADLILVAPATAHALTSLANGYAEDMLTTLVLAAECPLAVAPAMNPTMFGSEQVQDALRVLRERGAIVISPDSGDVACGENGQGKLASIEKIVQEVSPLLALKERLKGKRVLITSGPTQEAVDDVRVLTNHSSGRMGAALARAALMLGAKVTVVTGPTETPIPAQAEVIRVKTAEQMLSAAQGAAEGADFIIGAAAVSDYRPADPVKGKIRRGDSPELTLRLVPNPDIIAELAKGHPGAQVIAFAAEPDEGLDAAREKMQRKGVQAIAINDISRPDIGFGSDHNELTLLFADGRQASSGRLSKLGCALWLFGNL